MPTTVIALHFPAYKTKRLFLRQITVNDRPQILRGMADVEVTAFYGGRVTEECELATQEHMDWYQQLHEEKSGTWWAMCLLDAPDQLIGTCGLYNIDQVNRNADIGYWLFSKHWGKGLMREALQCVITHAFQVLHLHRIEAEIEPDNIASTRLLLKLGWQREGRRRQVAWKNERFVDMEYYALLYKDTPAIVE